VAANATHPVPPWVTRPESLPRGSYVQLDGRGRTFVRDTAPIDAGRATDAKSRPAVLLLHGWMATGALNWYSVFDAVHVTVRFDPRTNTVLAFAAEDNLVKGASGQAVQNANLVLGLSEQLGLSTIGVVP
jgi:hypothetical protein